jgi:hypothetical protein
LRPAIPIDTIIDNGTVESHIEPFDGASGIKEKE